MKRMFSVRVILIMIFISTIVFIISNKKILYKDYGKLKYHYKELMGANSFDISLLNKTKNLIAVRNMHDRIEINIVGANGELKAQNNLIGFSNKAIIGSSTNCFHDSLRAKTYTILFKGNSKYILTEIPDTNYERLSHTEIYDHSDYHSVIDSTCIINELTMFPPSYANDFALESYKNGYRFSINDSLFKKIIFGKLEDVDKEIIEKEIKNVISYEDLVKSINEFQKKNYFNSRFKAHKHEVNNGFLSARIVGFLDSSENSEEILIYITSQRWVKSRLISFNVNSKTVSWIKEFNPEFYDIRIKDIDADGINEILMSSFSHCNQADTEQNKETLKMDKMHSFFTILDNNGNFKRVNDNEVIIKSEQGYYQWKYYLDEENHRIILGLYSPYDSEIKKLLSYELKTNIQKETTISYRNLIDIIPEKDKVVLYNINNENVEKLTCNPDFSAVKRISSELSRTLHGHYRTKKQKILDNEYVIFNYLSIRDEKLNEVFLDEFNSSFFEFHKNVLFLINRDNKYSERLVKLEFFSDPEVNPWAIALLSLELFLICLAFILNFFVMVPLYSSQKSYLVLFSFFNRLYYWRIFGQLDQVYIFTKKISKRIAEFDKILDELSDAKNSIYKRKLIFLKIDAYELKNWEVMQLIQEIAHDLKNRILSIKMTHLRMQFLQESDTNTEAYQELSKSFEEDLDEISEISTNLSNFSRLNELNFEKVKLYDYVREIIMNYSTHDLYENIVLKELIDCTINIDRYLFKAAIVNILNNALDEINHTEFVEMNLIEKLDTVIIEISNPGIIEPDDIKRMLLVGGSNKQNGTGVGIPATRMIIEKHNGNFRIDSSNGVVIVTIELKKEKNYDEE